MSRAAVFLDRDGVLNRTLLRDGILTPPRSLEELEWLPGAAEACAALERAGLLRIVVTNQPDVARGLTTLELVEAIHGALRSALSVDDVRVCPHDDADRCACRKPEPGLLTSAARQWDVDLSRSVMVGDRARDVEAGRAAGCRTVFVGRGPSDADLIVPDLASAVPWILDVTGRDDWNAHWTEFSASASLNPAQAFRRELVLTNLALEGTRGDVRVVDFGSGQGDVLAAVHERSPRAALLGVERSHVGVELARLRVPAARFVQRDLLDDLEPRATDRGWATHAICSEVLEHVDDPARFLRNASAYLAPGAKLVVTVPGGERSAFDVHLGHRRHFTTDELRALLEGVGFTDVSARGAGFPFFDLYRIVVRLRGARLLDDARGPPSRMSRAAMEAFRLLFRFNSRRLPWGSQRVATAVVPDRSRRR